MLLIHDSLNTSSVFVMTLITVKTTLRKYSRLKMTCFFVTYMEL